MADDAEIRRLLALYRATHYRARLPGATIVLRIGAACPAALRVLLGRADPYAFISACNPLSQATPIDVNRRATRRMFALLQQQAQRIFIGYGSIPGQAWRESALLATGLTLAQIDTLAGEFGQNAVLHGSARGPVIMRVYRDDWRSALGSNLTTDSAIEWVV